MGFPVAILLSTCDAYVHIARMTCQLIRQFWLEHPAIYVCGCSQFPDEKMISFSCDSKDWVGITYEAVSELEKIGYEYCYLILEDHIPFGECNSHYLNKELPKMAQRLGAVHVSLVGWDQFHPSNGKICGVEYDHWMNNSVDYKWKFDLHPGFWELKSFKEILSNFVPDSSRIFSAREFEGLAGTPDVTIPLALKQSTYKIYGDESAEGNRWFQKKWKRAFIRKVIHSLRLMKRMTTGSEGLEKLDTVLQIYTNYFNGPYPMYWSGIMTKGQINDNAIRFFRLVRCNEMAESVEGILDQQGHMTI